MQTHAAESEWEVKYCLKKFGVSPLGLMKKTNFLGPEVGLTHCNIIDDKEINLLGKTKTNVILTPICNTRDAADGNGIAPFTKLREKGANVSIGVDGPASNDSLNFLDELRYLRVVSRAKEGLYWHKETDQNKYSYMSPLETLSLANLGGKKTLNRTDIGSIEKGKAADFAIFDPNKEISHAGAVNKWASLLSCSPIKPKYLIINGRIVVEEGQVKTIATQKINSEFRSLHKKVIDKAQRSLRLDLTNYPKLTRKEIQSFVS
jgi:cytosine/adenosine deaminase-related metal-dependent hydrolase